MSKMPNEIEQRITRMMDYMGIYAWVIPSYGLPFPSKLSNSYYRPTRTYRINRNCRINYFGASHKILTHGVVREIQDINVLDMEADHEYLVRAYVFLKGDCLKVMGERTKSSGMKYLPKLIKKFKRLEFLDETGISK